jgi:hypothetical protein
MEKEDVPILTHPLNFISAWLSKSLIIDLDLSINVLDLSIIDVVLLINAIDLTLFNAFQPFCTCFTTLLPRPTRF